MSIETSLPMHGNRTWTAWRLLFQGHRAWIMAEYQRTQSTESVAWRLTQRLGKQKRVYGASIRRYLQEEGIPLVNAIDERARRRFALAVHLRLGGHSYAQIAEYFGVSRSRAYQLVMRGEELEL